jgi:APA family basic amino acid/polyamine antiporter
MEREIAVPKKTLSLTDGLALMIGIVVGTGIYKTPSLVAANTGTDTVFFLAWILGGAISLVGALCYAELATAYPHAGGDYHFLNRAYGQKVAFLFGWARMTVIQPGSIALLAYVFGDYLVQILPALPSHLYAMLAIVGLTTLNVLGTPEGTWTQKVLTGLKVIGLLGILLVGAFFAPAPLPAENAAAAGGGSFGLAMVFVLLTFGGWNEAVYISAELEEGWRKMVRILMLGLGLITAIYLLAGFAYLRGLGGIAAMSQSDVVAADVMRRTFGEQGAQLVSLLIAVSVLGAINGDLFTGARTNYALGRDFPLFAFLGRWQAKANVPANAVLLQGGMACALVLLGALTRKGFVTMVEFIAPIFWLFFLLTGLSLFVLRRKDPDTPRPFKTPLYPLVPILFCGSCLYMLQSSLAYTGIGALAGVGVFLVGGLFLALSRVRQGNTRDGVGGTSSR